MSTDTMEIAPEPQAAAVTQPDTETPLEGFASICSMLAVYLFLTAFIFQNFQIPSASMEKTLLIGDHPLVDRITFAPQSKWFSFLSPSRDIRRGDVIVFYKPNPETPDLILVKRAIGIPGDRIHLRNGVVFLNGIAQNEPQIPRIGDGNPADAYSPYRDDFPSVSPDTDMNVTSTWSVELASHIQGEDLVVPPGKVFAMGDNRVASLDGRFWGFVPRENILGRPLLIYWSFKTGADEMYKTSMGDRLAFMFHVVTHFATETRWDRTMHVVR